MVGLVFDVRRAGISLLLAALSFVGLVSADLGDEVHVTVPALDEGSAGRFDLEREGPDGSSRQPYLWFGRQEASRGLTAGGERAWLQADVVHLAQRDGDAWAWGPQRRWEHDRATGDLVRVVDPSVRPDGSLTLYADDMAYQDLPPPPCLLALQSGVQGRQGSLFGPCLLSWPDGDRPPLDLSQARFGRDGSVLVGGLPAHVYLQQGAFPDGRSVEVWIQDGLPVPTRLVVHDGGETWTWRRSDQPLPPPPVSTVARIELDPPAAPAFELRDARRWGPESGPWDRHRIEEAWSDARLDADVSAFLLSHPDAGVVHAEWQNAEFRPPFWSDRWVLVVDDGKEALRIQWDAALPHSTSATVASDPVPSTGAVAPSQWPTVASVARRHEAFSNDLTPPLHIVYRAAPPGREPSISTQRSLEPTWDPLAELPTVGYRGDGPTEWTFDLDGTARRGLASTYSNQPPPASAAIHSTTHAATTPAPPQDLDLVRPGLVAVAVAVLYQFLPVLKSGAAALFSRIDRSDVLRHEARRDVLRLVEDEPGIHKSELARRSGLAGGQLQHHLGVLCAHGLVVTRRYRGYTCYFPPGAGEEMWQAPALRSPTARRALDLVRQRPGVNGSDLAGLLGVTQSTLHYHLKRLVDLDLVRRERTGRRVRLWPSTEKGDTPPAPQP